MLGTFAKFYRLDAIANSNTEFGRRVLMLAELQSRHFHSDSDSWGNNSIGLHKCTCNTEYVIESLLGSTFWNFSLWLLTLLDQTLGGGFLRSDIHHPICMAPYLGSSVSFPEMQ